MKIQAVQVYGYIRQFRFYFINQKNIKAETILEHGIILK